MATNIGNMLTTLVGRTRGFQRMRQQLYTTQQRADAFTRKAGGDMKNFSFMTKQYTRASAMEWFAWGTRVNAAITTNLEKARNKIAKFEKNFARHAKRIQVAGERFMRIGYYTSMYITLPLVAAGGAAVAFQKRFGTAMHQMVNLMDMSREQMLQWKEEVVGLAPKTGFTPFQLIKSLRTIIQNGVEAGEAMNVLRESAIAAGAGLQRSVLPIATATASAIDTYGKNVLSAKEATSVFLKLVAAEGMQPRMLSQSMSKAMSSAADLGVSLNDLAAAMDLMTDTGERALWAGLQLNKLFSNMARPSDKAEKALNQVGSSFNELRRILSEKGLAALLQRIGQLWEKNQGVLKGNILNTTAYDVILKTTRNDTEKYIKTFEKWNDEIIDTDKVLNEAGKTMQMTWKRALATGAAAFVRLGDALKGPLSKAITIIASGIDWLANKIENLNDKQIKARMNFAKWLALLGPASMILGLLGSILGNIILLVSKIAWFIKYAFFTSLGLLITAITAVVGITTIWIVKNIQNRKEMEKTKRLVDEYGVAMKYAGGTAQQATKELRKQSSELEVYKDRLKTVSNEINTMRNRLNGMKKGSVEYEIVSEKLATLEATRKEIIMDINSEFGQYLDNEIKAGMAYNEIATQLKNVNQQLERRIAIKASESAKEALMDEAAQRYNNIKALKKEIDNYKDRKQAIKNQQLALAKAKSINGSVTELIRKRMELDARRVKLQKDLNKAQEDLENQEARYAEIKKQLKELNEELSDLIGNFGDLSKSDAEDFLTKIKDIFGGLGNEVMSFQDKIAFAFEKEKLFGDEFDHASYLAKLYKGRIEELIKAQGDHSKRIEVLMKHYKLWNSLTEEAMQEVTQETEQSISIWKQLQQQLDVAAVKEGQLGDEFDENRAKLRAYQQAMNEYAEIVASGEATDQQIKNMEKVGQYIKKLKEEIRSLKEETLDWGDISKRAASTLGRIYAQMAQSIGQSLAQQENAMQSFVSTALRTAQQVLAAMLAEVMGAVLRGAANLGGLAGLLTVGTIGVAAANAMWQKHVQSQMDKAQGMASGGTVPGGYPNDSYPAMLSTGEKVLPPEDLDREKLDGTMQIEIDGRIGFDELAFAVSEYNRKKSNTF